MTQGKQQSEKKTNCACLHCGGECIYKPLSALQWDCDPRVLADVCKRQDECVHVDAIVEEATRKTIDLKGKKRSLK